MSAYFFNNDAVPWTELGDGIRRKIVGHTPALMSVLVQFDKGAVGTAHQHELHHQSAYVLAGAFEAEVGGVKKRIGVGEAFIVPPNTLHGVVALEANSLLLDQFSPPRDDYLNS